MPDPFDILRTPLTPLAPDPGFAAELRSRMAEALLQQEGTTIVSTTSSQEASVNTDDRLHSRHGDIGYVSLWVPDVNRATDFYAGVLGWSYHPSSDPAHARQVAGQSLAHGLFGGQPRSTLFLCMAVDDINTAVERVRGAGGTATEPVSEPFGLMSECVDDQGMAFALFRPPPGPAGKAPENGERHGDISYITIEVIDSARFRAFFGAVLGWRFQPGRVDDGWGVEDISPMTGIHGGHAQTTGVPMYRVDDIGAAVRRVHAAGGTATDAEAQPYGMMSDCTDDQGTHFYLGQH